MLASVAAYFAVPASYTSKMLTPGAYVKKLFIAMIY
jgi:hypothetical protein